MLSGRLDSFILCFGNGPMSVDTYAICPCGSGKKIKFCKCKDSVSELDRIMKMVEGGQVVPALDRLASILQEHPDAAWALAIRGRLLLDLREYDSLVDNADRFIRLQPSNPLALTQRAAAKLFRGDLEEGTESILEALTESGRDVDSFVLDVASVLAYSLAQKGAYLTARVYGTLAMMASGYQSGETAVSVLRQLNSSAAVNQLLKSIPDVIGRPADVEWGERYDEAAGLLNSTKVVLAQSKFESLARTLPGEPAILSGLLTCAIWRGDTDAQSSLLGKLSACPSLDFEQRVRFRAMSALVNPNTPELSVEVFELKADIENADEIEMAMTADARFVSLPPDMLKGMHISEDSVPPKAGFQLLDRDAPESLDSLPPLDQVPESEAMLLIFGKQTDRSARIEVFDVRSDNLEDVRSRVSAVLGDVELQQENGEPLPLAVVCQPPLAMIRFHAKPAEAESLQLDLAAARMSAAVASAKFPILGDQSLRDVAGDDSKLLERTAVVRIIEQYDLIASKGDNVVSEVYELAGLEPLPAIVPQGDEVESLANEDLNRVDSSGLNFESLFYLVQRSQQISATPALRRFASQLVKLEVSEEQKQMKLLAYMALVNASAHSSAALETLDEAKKFVEANGLPMENLLLSEVSLRLSAGDGQGFQKAIEVLSTQYGNQPEVMARLQQMLMAFGLIGPDGAPRAQPPAAGGPPAPLAAGGEGGGGGIWTPDGGAPAAPAGEGGQSKLWVPGMD